MRLCQRATLDEAEQATRVAAGDQDREARHDHGNQRRDDQDEQHDVERDGEQPFDQRQPPVQAPGGVSPGTPTGGSRWTVACRPSGPGRSGPGSRTAAAPGSSRTTSVGSPGITVRRPRQPALHMRQMRALLVPDRTVSSCTLAHSSSCRYRGLRYPPGTHNVNMHMSWERTGAERTLVMGALRLRVSSPTSAAAASMI